MKGYYSDRLSGEQLRFCYELATPRVQRYLDEEIRHLNSRFGSSDVVLELGCGYGRVMEVISRGVEMVVGIDTSIKSLQLAKKELRGCRNCKLARMDAADLGFRKRSFDGIFCIQNGISAFGTDPLRLIGEALRVARSGGRILFSSYSDKFWEERLAWFRLQSEHGLLEAIDNSATGNGVIVCRDGFKATTVGPAQFNSFAHHFGIRGNITEVDGSSIFWEIEAK